MSTGSIYTVHVHCTVPFLLVLLLRILSEDPYHLSILPNKEREGGRERERLQMKNYNGILTLVRLSMALLKSPLLANSIPL